MENKNQLKSDWQESFTVQQLKDVAKTIGLKNYSKLKKKDLIDLIKNSIQNPISNNSIYNNPIYLPTIVDNLSENKLKSLEKEVKKLRLKCNQQEERDRVEKEKIEKERKEILEKEEKEREKYRQVIKKYNNRRWGENFSDEEQKIMEIITGIRFYMANCRDRQQLIEYCKEKKYPVPDINGNF
jgi:hypothetical protein